MNAVLQIFSNIKEFGDYFINKEYLNKKKNRPITNALTTVIKNLWNKKNKTYRPLEFKKIIGQYNPQFLKNEPNDSRELIQYLLEVLHEELNENINKEYNKEDDNLDTDWKKKLEYERESFSYENKSLISDLFYGIQGTETYCINCKKETYVFEHFCIISLPMLNIKNGIIDIKNMLMDYEKEIKMEGNNKNYCSICEDEYDAIYQNFFYETPEILIIHPARKNKGNTYSVDINFEETIDLTPYLSKNIKKKLKIVYELFGIIYHTGTSGYGGHNFSFCKIKNNWYEFNDSNIRQVSFDEIMGKGVILMFYKKKKN